MTSMWSDFHSSLGSFGKENYAEKDLEMIVYPVIQAGSVELLENV